MKLLRYLALAVMGVTAPHVQAQTPAASSSEILLQLKKLNVTGSVLYIAAHPDDENTRLLAYLASERKLRTGYLSLTRGDGGQNLIGKEQGEMLGLIRTQELLAARRTDGAEQFFSRAFDFGFSKNPQETFTFWNKGLVLSDVVWVIRNFKPDVIICRFPTTGEGGHGHHTASAILAEEAFKIAGDPRWFPEQLQYTQVWQPKRIFWNTFNFGGLNTTSESQMKIDVGGYNQLLGKSYGEIAAASRSNHKSQGFGSASTRGESFEYFKQLAGSSAKKDLFDGINTSWSRIPGGTAIQAAISKIIAQYNIQAPERSIPQLVAVYRQLQSLSEKNPETHYWKTQKEKELKAIILDCAGIWMEAAATDYKVMPGASIPVNTQIILRKKAAVELEQLVYAASDTAMQLQLKPNQLYAFKHADAVPVSQAYSTPYWLQQPHNTGAFIVDDQLMIGKAENGPALSEQVHLKIDGVRIDYEIPVVYKYTDPVKGEVYRPLEVLPPLTINLPEAVNVFRNGKGRVLSLTVKANKPDVNGRLSVTASGGWYADVEQPEIHLKSAGDEAIIQVYVEPVAGVPSSELKASVRIDGNSYEKSIRRIDYEHIPAQFTLSSATTRLVSIDMYKSGNNIGYIAGAGDEIPSCLQQVGYKVTMLNDDMIEQGDLSAYDAIVTGVRAYNTNPKMQQHYKALMNYVKKGGNLIVQYNTNNRISSVPVDIGPYPFTITRDRVTDEHAAVTFLRPDHAVFHFPNEITQADFDGWIQERGIYFATDSLNKYTKVLSMADPKENAQDGSLLIKAYGRGNFVYAGLAFFRELPAGVPGAYRLFANLLGLPVHEKR
ncbi:PIG-L family deacetylase [Rurimicrobium arvi]|uniref:PIG-L family deacetylase n=1 Tax=Rurimicrobium arvi TaxID=2049916 RepID=A0ABP8MLB8_9BACT